VRDHCNSRAHWQGNCGWNELERKEGRRINLQKVGREEKWKKERRRRRRRQCWNKSSGLHPTNLIPVIATATAKGSVSGSGSQSQKWRVYGCVPTSSLHATNPAYSHPSNQKTGSPLPPSTRPCVSASNTSLLGLLLWPTPFAAPSASRPITHPPYRPTSSTENPSLTRWSPMSTSPAKASAPTSTSSASTTASPSSPSSPTASCTSPTPPSPSPFSSPLAPWFSCPEKHATVGNTKLIAHRSFRYGRADSWLNLNAPLSLSGNSPPPLPDDFNFTQLLLLAVHKQFQL